MLTFLQMFKSLLTRGIEDILIIFNDAPAPQATEVQENLDEANAIAAPLWNDDSKPLSARQTECRRILDPVIFAALAFKSGRFYSVPVAMSEDLNKVFRKHYTSDKFLLIGRNTEEAYNAQDAYAREVGRLLGTTKRRLQSRAIVRLGKAYGRTSIPLLSMASVSALWQISKSSFYKRQLSLVSPVCWLACCPTDSRLRSISGSNPLQSHRTCRMLDATTSPPCMPFSDHNHRSRFCCSVMYGLPHLCY